MSYTPKILAFAGSLRSGSLNKKTVKVAIKGAIAAGAEVTYIDLKDYPLPVYDGDIEAESGLPENAVKLQEIMSAHDGFLISSPENNSSVPGAFKNMIDWTSRPRGDIKAGASYADKVAVIMSASPGGLGGLRGLFDLRKILYTMGVIILPQEFALARANQAFDEDDNPKEEFVKTTLEGLGKTLAEFLIKLNR